MGGEGLVRRDFFRSGGDGGRPGRARKHRRRAPGAIHFRKLWPVRPTSSSKPGSRAHSGLPKGLPEEHRLRLTWKAQKPSMARAVSDAQFRRSIRRSSHQPPDCIRVSAMPNVLPQQRRLGRAAPCVTAGRRQLAPGRLLEPGLRPEKKRAAA